MTKTNDIDKTNWKDFSDISSSLWLINRDSDKQDNKLHGCFVYQVAENLVIRYTKKEELVVDLFAGSGTTQRVCKALKRSCIGYDLSYKESLISSYNGFTIANIPCDTTKNDEVISNFNGKAKLVILHPPYFDIVKFSDNPDDMSNLTMETFIDRMKQVFNNAFNLLQDKGYIALVFGDIYKNGRLYPASDIADIAKQFPLILRAIYVKNMEGNEKSGQSGKNANLWKYRSLVGGFAIFKHEYIYVWRKG